MNLLQDIQAAAVDSSVSLVDLLRKCAVLAARLRHGDFKQWVTHELDGYPGVDALPEYRILKVHSLGSFFGPFGSSLHNAPIPPLCIPEKFRDMVETAPIVQPISSLVCLVEGDKDSTLRIPWPADLVVYLAQNIYQDMNCMSAWRVVSRGQVVGIIDTVRNRILSFVLEIEAEIPDAGQWPSGGQPVSQEKVNQVFQTRIYGHVGSVVSGSRDFSIDSPISVAEGNLDSLIKVLSSLGIEQGEINALRAAIEKDATDEKQSGIGSRVAQWLASTLTKACAGALKCGANAAATILTQALFKYYGIA